MMRNYVLALLFTSLSLSIFAQGTTNRSNRRDELEAQKVAYITSTLSLTTEEAQQFWPVYNEYRSALDALRREHQGKRMRSDDEDDQKLTDVEMDALIKSRFAQERKKVDLDEKYYEKFKKVLPIPKVAAYYRAERSFKRELLDQLRQRPNGGARPQH